MFIKRNRLLPLLFLLFLSTFTFAQKTTLTYNIVAYVEQQTADYFGGKQAIEDSITRQLNRVNALFNSQSSLNNYYNFTPVAFNYYTDNATDDNTLALYRKPAESNNRYRIVYNAFPKLNDNKYHIAFDIAYQSVIFSYDESYSGNGNIFERVMTTTLAHELGHSRGAWDLYAGNIKANQNLVNTNLGWSNPTPSLMNSLFTDTVIDQHSAYLINKTAATYGASTFTYEQRSALTGAAFPQTISVSVKNSNGSAISNAVVKFYSVPWFPSNEFTISPSTPAFTYNTDNNGLVSFTGSANNPFNVTYGSPEINTFFVTVTYNNQTKYAWIPFYEVSNAFIQGNTSYVKTISFGTTNIPPTVSLSPSGSLIGYEPLSTVFAIWTYDLDGSIGSVKIYDNGTYVGDANIDNSNKSYWYYPSNLPIGKHSFVAVSTDNSGASATSSPLVIDVKPAHVVSTSITSPASNAAFTAPATIPVTAFAIEGGGSISKVEFYNGTTLLGTSTTRPFTYNWTNVPAGTYSLTVKAYDAQTTPVVATSAAVTVVVNPSAGNSCTNVPVYAPYPSVYNQGDYVQYNNVKYQSQVNGLYNVTPGTAEYYWKTIGACGTSLTPTVSITAPANNTVYNTTPAIITITANASETGGSISKVEFYKGTTLLGTSTASPYTYNWTNVAAGSYTINVKAYDAQSTPASATASVNVYVNTPPAVSITAPASNAVFKTVPATISITANATDADGISKVEFYNGTTLLGTSTASPYVWSWTNVAAGTYTITAKAYDTKGGITTSAAVSNILVNAAPVTSITSPANNASFTATATITISASATDADGISKVEFYNGTSLLGTVTASPYTYTWTGVGTGTYSLTTKAYDTRNIVTQSAAVNISVTGGGSCTAPQYVAGTAYVAGNVVKNQGSSYQCKPFPYSGWCGGSASAYAPGSGTNWTDAWTLVGPCAKLALNGSEINAALSVYPNPVSDKLTVNVGELMEGEVTLSLTDVAFKNIITETVNLHHGSTTVELNLDTIENGIYFLQVQNQGTTVSIRKIIKLK